VSALSGIAARGASIRQSPHIQLSFAIVCDYSARMTSETHPPRTLLQTLEVMAEDAAADGFSLREIMDRLDERAFGAILFILAIPCAIPFLYGVPQVVAVPMLAFAAQMAAGREEPWLPGKLGERRIGKQGLTNTARRGRKWFGWVEWFARPRLTFLTGKGPERVIGLILCAFCLSIMVPLPLTNSTPAIGVALASFGLIQRDGLLVIIGLAIGIAWISLLLIGGEVLIRQIIDLVR